MLCLVSQSCRTLCYPMDCSPSGSSVHGDSIGKNTGVGCHALLQGIFPTQGSNPGLLYCRWILYHLRHQGSPYQSYLCHNSSRIKKKKKNKRRGFQELPVPAPKLHRGRTSFVQDFTHTYFFIWLLIIPLTSFVINQ